MSRGRAANVSLDGTAAGIHAGVREVGRTLRAHAGGLELLSVSPVGLVRVRFLGACSGCPLRPLTLAATVRPHLRRVPGVTEVEDEGGRVSAEAQERLRALAPSALGDGR